MRGSEENYCALLLSCTKWVLGIKLRSSGLAASAEPPSALGGVLSGQEPRFFLGGGILFNRSVRLRSSGSTTDRTRAASPEGECSVVTLETQTEQRSDITAAPGTPSNSGATTYAFPQHPVACPPGSLPVPPLEGSRHRLRSPYATNFRTDPPIARLWRRSNGKTMPRHCSAAGCCTRDTRETRNRGISFHRLPKKDNPRRGLWLANCQRLDPSGQGLWDPASEYIYFCSKHFEENCFELVGISGYHRLKEGAVPTIFESFSKLRRTTKTKGHGYPPGLPDVSRLRRCRKRCSEGQGPTTPFSPIPANIICFPVEEASAPATLPTSPAVRLEPGLNSPFSDLLGSLGAQADEAGCSAQPSPERHPSPLEPRPISPSAYMLRLPPPAGAYIQNEHSYQVGSALLWKRRAEAALDALDKAQRQLQACKRREQRLRLRLTKLQQERAREKRAQADARQTLKDHVQDFAMQLSNSMA
ncbi:THAP domain-containing protein 7 [Lemmus lemmus]